MDPREQAYTAELAKHRFQMHLDPLGACVVAGALLVLKATLSGDNAGLADALVHLRDGVQSLGPADVGHPDNALAAAVVATKLEFDVAEWLVGVIETANTAAAAVDG